MKIICSFARILLIGRQSHAFEFVRFMFNVSRSKTSFVKFLFPKESIVE